MPPPQSKAIKCDGMCTPDGFAPKVDGNPFAVFGESSDDDDDDDEEEGDAGAASSGTKTVAAAAANTIAVRTGGARLQAAKDQRSHRPRAPGTAAVQPLS